MLPNPAGGTPSTPERGWGGAENTSTGDLPWSLCPAPLRTASNCNPASLGPTAIFSPIDRKATPEVPPTQMEFPGREKQIRQQVNNLPTVVKHYNRAFSTSRCRNKRVRGRYGRPRTGGSERSECGTVSTTLWPPLCRGQQPAHRDPARPFSPPGPRDHLGERRLPITQHGSETGLPGAGQDTRFHRNSGSAAGLSSNHVRPIARQKAYTKN